MPVFVDELPNLMPGAENLVCHLASPNEAELHDMAGWMGLKRNRYRCRRYRHDGSLLVPAHYELETKRREVAIRLGATPVSNSELLILCGTDRLDVRFRAASDIEPSLRELLHRWASLPASVKLAIMTISSRDG